MLMEDYLVLTEFGIVHILFEASTKVRLLFLLSEDESKTNLVPMLLDTSLSSAGE